MIYRLLNISDGNTGIFMLAILLASFFVVFAGLKIGRKILPRDHGKEFAVGGAQSAGKYTGSGIIIISGFIIICALFIPLDIELIIYLAAIFLSMLSGFLDDGAKIPWGRVKKGLLDLVIAVGASSACCYFNGSTVNLLPTTYTITLHPVLYILLGAALIWGSINVTNCSDGVDGLCGTLSLISLGTGLVILNYHGGGYFSFMIISFMLCLIVYLWYNANPSTMLMGDAGSRPIGVLLAVMMMKTGAPHLYLLVCLMLIIDGGASLLKISCIKFLKLKDFMKNIRTPIHDHLKKNKEWSPTQVVTRLAIIQLVISFAVIFLV